MAAATWEAWATDRSTFDEKLLNVGIGEPEEVLNDMGAFDLTMAMKDPQMARIQKWATEIRVKRNGVVKWAGPVVAPRRAAPGIVKVGCFDLWAYTKSRYIDRASGRINYLTNPQFEDSGGSLTGWTAHGGITATASTAQRVLGSHSAKLVNSTVYADTYLGQPFSMTGTGVGTVVFFAGWFYLDRTQPFTGPAIDDFGLYLRQTDGSGNVYADDEDMFQINGDTAPNVWTRARVLTRIPPLATHTIDPRLYVGGYTIYYDALSITIMESLAFQNVDQALIAQGIVEFLQDTTYGKSDLGLATSCPTTGIIRSRAIQHADHIQGYPALAEYPDMDDGFDMGWDYNTRTFKTFFPRRGTDRTATITLTVDGNCRLVDWADDGWQAADSITALGLGDGPDREEGSAADSGALGGVTVQKIVSPRGSPSIDSLTPTAERELALSTAPTAYEVEITDRTIADTVEVGDDVTLVADTSVVGPLLATSGPFRIVKKRWQPKPDLPVVLLNPKVA